MTVLIVDDDTVFSGILLEAMTKISGQMHFHLEIEAEQDPQKCLEGHKPYDVYFIDIEMSQLSGIDLVKQLQKKYIDKEFVFFSAYSDYMRSSMCVRPRGFVRKEHLMDDLRETLEVLKAVLQKGSAEIVVKDNLKDVWIRPDRVLYMKSEEHYVRICMDDGEDRLIRNKIRVLEPKMAEYDFLRIHLRYLVNLNYVQDYYRCRRMVLKNGEELPISTRYAQSVNEIFMNWVMSGKH